LGGVRNEYKANHKFEKSDGVWVSVAPGDPIDLLVSGAHNLCLGQQVEALKTQLCRSGGPFNRPSASAKRPKNS